MKHYQFISLKISNNYTLKPYKDNILTEKSLLVFILEMIKSTLLRGLMKH